MSYSTTLGIGSVRERVDYWTPRLLGVALAVVLWYLLSLTFPLGLMPGPLETVALTADLYMTGGAFEHLVPTLTRIIFGFIGAMVVGTAVGIAMGTSTFGRKIFAPYIVAGLALPSVAVAAIATLIFGLTLAAPVSTAVIAVFPFIAINVWKGVEDIDQSLLEMTRSFDISNRRMIRRVVLPSIAPALFSAFRFGLALSWKVVTVAEVFASSDGVGWVIFQTYQQTFFTQTWAWAAVFIVVIIVVEYLLFRPLETYVFSYRQDAELEMSVR